MRSLVIYGFVGFVVLAGCAQKAEPPTEPAPVAPVAEWQPVTPEEMTETQKAQHELCLAATNAMMAETLDELERALDAGSAAEAVNVCKIRSRAIAAYVADQFGLTMGRTSHKLRNPDNVPPPWAEGLVAARTPDPAFLAGPNGELGALLPVRLKAECQVCHGPVEMIDEEIQAALDAEYPTDQGVGFVEGDLRGWIWVEAPPGDDDDDMTEF